MNWGMFGGDVVMFAVSPSAILVMKKRQGGYDWAELIVITRKDCWLVDIAVRCFGT